MNIDNERLSEKELQEFNRDRGHDGPRIPVPAWVDLVIANKYADQRSLLVDDPEDQLYTQEEILNLTPDQVEAFDRVFNFYANRSTLTYNRKRILRILSYLGLIQYDHDILLQTTILDDLCSHLSPYDLNMFRIAIYQHELPCRVEVRDRDHLVTFLDQVNFDTVLLSNRIKRGGSKAALLTAVKLGELDNVRTLLNRGVSPNPALKTRNPLIVAAGNGDVDMVNLLLERGADPTIKGEYNKTALTEVIHHDHVVEILETKRELIVQALIRAQPDLEKQNGQMALYYAIYSLNLVRILLDAGVNPGVIIGAGLSPLVYAVDQNKFEVVKLLLERGAPINEADGFGDTALSTAVKKGYHDIIALLIENGADVDLAKEFDGTPLIIAANSNDIQSVQMLIEAGANPDLTRMDDLTALDVARESGFQEIVEILEPITSSPEYNESYEDEI